MAKTKDTGPITLTFPATGNPWIDAGTVGLYRVLQRKPSYLEPLGPFTDELPGSGNFSDVSVRLECNSLSIEGPANEVEACLSRSYDCLIESYYNVSSQRQRERSEGFYLNSKTCEFVSTAKRNAAGSAILMSHKQFFPTASQTPWARSENGKQVVGHLSEQYAHLQDKLDKFLKEHKLPAGPKSGLLVDGEMGVRPKVRLQVGSKKQPGTCFLIGQDADGVATAFSHSFPLISELRGFTNSASDRPKIGWQTDFVGKFVPAVAFFSLQGEQLDIFLPESSDLRRIDETATRLQGMLQVDANLLRNFDFHLKGVFERTSELTLAFLHRVFRCLSASAPILHAQAETLAALDEDNPFAEESSAEPEQAISTGDVYEAVARGGAVHFTIVSAAKQGQVWMPHSFWSFRDTLYVARLLNGLQEIPPGSRFPRCRLQALLSSLLDEVAQQGNRSLTRDRFCRRVLAKQSVLKLVEEHAFRIAAAARPRAVAPLLDFIRYYEVARMQETPEEANYAQMVEKATWLGNTIGKHLAEAVARAVQPESAGRARGAMFRLRKTRTVSDFLDELSRLQQRYSIQLPPKALDATLFNHGSFDEFRGFCVVAALSRFQWKPKQKTASQTSGE
jgi:hypothetical protein